MTSHVLRTPKTITVGVHQLVYIAIGLAAAVLVVAALASSSGNATVSGKAVTSGRAVAVTVSQPDDDIPPGSGVTFGRHPK